MSCLRESLNRIFWALAENERVFVVSEGQQHEVRFVSPSKCPSQIAAACLNVDPGRVQQHAEVVMCRGINYNCFASAEAEEDFMDEAGHKDQPVVLMTVAFCSLSAAFEDLMRVPPVLCSDADEFLATASRLYGREHVASAVRAEPIFCSVHPDSPESPSRKRSRVNVSE